MALAASFSWRKLLSFFGAGLLFFLACVTIAGGAFLCSYGDYFNGVFTVVSGLGDFYLAYLVYRSYNRWMDANK